MDVSVIIVNYKTANLIANCVESIIDKTHGVTYEVIILDNNSEPDFENIISKKIPEEKVPYFQFISLNENIGFGRANNEGLNYASGRNILFLNPDTVLLNNAIKILSDFLDKHDDIGACGGNLLGEDLLPTQSFFRFLPGLFYEIDNLFNTYPQRILYGKNRTYNYRNKPLEVAYIIGADLMIKKTILEKVGGFSDKYFLYYDETDLCARIIKNHYKIYNVPTAQIQHLEGKSPGAEYDWEDTLKPKIYEESKKIYYKQNLKKVNRLIAEFIYNLFLNSRILLVKNNKKKNWFKFRKKCFNEFDLG